MNRDNIVAEEGKVEDVVVDVGEIQETEEQPATTRVAEEGVFDSDVAFKEQLVSQAMRDFGGSGHDNSNPNYHPAVPGAYSVVSPPPRNNAPSQQQAFKEQLVSQGMRDFGGSGHDNSNPNYHPAVPGAYSVVSPPPRNNAPSQQQAFKEQLVSQGMKGFGGSGHEQKKQSYGVLSDLVEREKFKQQQQETTIPSSSSRPSTSREQREMNKSYHSESMLRELQELNKSGHSATTKSPSVVAVRNSDVSMDNKSDHSKTMLRELQEINKSSGHTTKTDLDSMNQSDHSSVSMLRDLESKISDQTKQRREQSQHRLEERKQRIPEGGDDSFSFGDEGMMADGGDPAATSQQQKKEDTSRNFPLVQERHSFRPETAPAAVVQQADRGQAQAAPDNVLVEANVVQDDGLTAEEFNELETRLRKKFIDETIVAENAVIAEPVDEREFGEDTKDDNTKKNQWMLVLCVVVVVIIAVVVSVAVRGNNNEQEVGVGEGEGEPEVPKFPMDDSHSRLIAYVDNSQPCPTTEQLQEYTHIVVSFAVSYESTGEAKNNCSQTCEIATPAVCDSGNNTSQNAMGLVREWKEAGKKVLLSFGGSGMGQSPDGINDCWEYCFGREEEVVDQLVDIADEMDLDGIDLNYMYYYENYQDGSDFDKGAEAVQFVKEVTMGLRQSLPVGAIVTHTPTDTYTTMGTEYFYTLRDIAQYLDFIMVSYYNGITRPALYGIANEGEWASWTAIDHYTTLVSDIFEGDAKKVVFGFCIEDCGGVSGEEWGDGGWNANATEAARIVSDLGTYYSCNGGAFFWSAKNDVNGSWSTAVSLSMPYKNETVCTNSRDVSHNRLVAFVGNWQPCPTADQVKDYTHIVISFAVSYQWAPDKNNCSETCEISTPAVCGNSQATRLVQEWKDAGKKVILSFGGSGMGHSSNGINNCWEYCFGRETQVVNQLTDIVDRMDLDGVDLNYVYYFEDYQEGSNFTKSAEAIHFLKQVTLGLRHSLPEGSVVTHSPLDAGITLGTKYFNLLKEVVLSLDFVMVVYYNGITNPVSDGILGFDADNNSSSSVAAVAAIDHYSTMVIDILGGDAKKIMFGFCIADCGAVADGGWNANAEEASAIMMDLAVYYPCNGGAFFWAAKDDIEGSWSGVVSSHMAEGHDDVCNTSSVELS